jgi:hypothetical protein
MQRIQMSGGAALTIVVALWFAGCSSRPQPVYQGKQGLRFTPPPGWVERDREDLLPAKPGQRQGDLPLPRLETPGQSAPEKLLVRYDRTIAGHLAWIRISVADLPAAASLKDAVSARAPQPDWKAEPDVADLEVSGMPAARAAFAGRWHDQDYLSETVAVRHEGQVYFITASFPAADAAAREQTRQAVDRATWK